MRRASAIALLVLSLCVAAIAHEGHKDKGPKDRSFTGEIIDITCYLDHESKGEKHAACARKCIEAGNPVGLLADGKVYVIIDSSHQAPNARLAPLAGKRVILTGNLIERGGLRAIDMEGVEPAGTGK